MGGPDGTATAAACPAAGKHPGLLPAAPGLACHHATGSPTSCNHRLTTQALHPDGDHHRSRHRRPEPPGPALRLPAWRSLRHPAEHHRGPQRLRQKPRPPGPRPASPPPRPRHRRPVHVHRAAADRREHPQDPRLASPHRPRQGPHHPAGTAAAGQPARLPPRRLTSISNPRHPDHLQPGRSAAPQAGPQPRIRPAGLPGPAAQQPSPVSQPGTTLKIRSPPQFCRFRVHGSSPLGRKVIRTSGQGEGKAIHPECQASPRYR